MGRLIDAAARVTDRKGGITCGFCAFIESLDGDDRTDLEHLAALPVTDLGHSRLSAVIEAELGRKIAVQTVGDCRRKGHRGSHS